MIALDANVIIALLSLDDSQHLAALDILRSAVRGGLGSSLLTVAETTVSSLGAGSHGRATRVLDELQLEIFPLDEADVGELARIRSE